MEVIDDGCGFEVKAARISGGLSLGNLQERARRINGLLKISTAIDH